MVTSHLTACADPPRPAIKPTVSRSVLSVRPATVTKHPSFASASAQARPIPVPPPVTKALFPSNGLAIVVHLPLGRADLVAPWDVGVRDGGLRQRASMPPSAMNAAPVI